MTLNNYLHIISENMKDKINIWIINQNEEIETPAPYKKFLSIP